MNVDDDPRQALPPVQPPRLKYSRPEVWSLSTDLAVGNCTNGSNPISSYEDCLSGHNAIGGCGTGNVAGRSYCSGGTGVVACLDGASA